MHLKWLEVLCDPVERISLRAEIGAGEGDMVVSGSLVAGDRRYPIVRGIPRFAGYAGDNYAKSFGWQWRRWPRVQFDSENVGRPMASYSRVMFERITGQTARLDEQTIVDVGCGPGRFVEVAREKGARVIGVDFSLAVETARLNFANDPDVLIVQADALRLPLASSRLDGAFSIGVLHHTPKPSQGVEELARITREGGWGAVCVYPKGWYYDFPTVHAWRSLFRTLWPVLGHGPALAYSYLTVYGLAWTSKLPVLGKAIRAALPFVPLPDRRWSVLDTFDSLTPSYQSAHDAYEVFRWLVDAGFVQVQPGDWGSTAWHGLRLASQSG